MRMGEDYSEDRVLTVTTILIEPYAMIRPHNSSSPLHINQLYEGFIVDMMDKISEVVGIKYRLIPVYDGTFGYKKPDGTWDGMIGEVTRKEADIAAGPMYITEQRAHSVDFTVPFMTVHASMIMRRAAHGGPRGIHEVHDLLARPDLECGTLGRGIIRKALRATNDTLFRALHERMMTSEMVAFTRTNEEGIERVRHDDYVYILPDKIAEYVSRRKPCDLVSVGSFLIDEKFGLAVPKGSALLPYLNRALTMLHRHGDLHRIYLKWWHNLAECTTVTSSKIFSPNKIVPRSSSSSSRSDGVNVLYSKWIVITCWILVLLLCH